MKLYVYKWCGWKMLQRGGSLSNYSMAEKKNWKISRGVMVIPSESSEFTHEGRRKTHRKIRSFGLSYTLYIFCTLAAVVIFMCIYCSTDWDSVVLRTLYRYKGRKYVIVERITKLRLFSLSYWPGVRMHDCPATSHPTVG